MDAVHGRFVHRFNRIEPRQSALAYLRGLIAPLERKKGPRRGQPPGRWPSKPAMPVRIASTGC